GRRASEVARGGRAQRKTSGAGPSGGLRALVAGWEATYIEGKHPTSIRPRLGPAYSAGAGDVLSGGATARGHPWLVQQEGNGVLGGDGQRVPEAAQDGDGGRGGAVSAAAGPDAPDPSGAGASSRPNGER